MKKYIERIKRNFVRETLCVNPTVVAVCAAVCACLGLIFCHRRRGLRCLL
ncbi:MAG: hypothetical protein IJ021_08650 [Clostridia bacterium]|nr:hypothetical protein [Clostridia bacterium]